MPCYIFKNTIVHFINICFVYFFTEADLCRMNEQKRYAYITYQDLRSVPAYNSQSVLVIKAPPESKLSVPLSEPIVKQSQSMNGDKSNPRVCERDSVY